MLSNLDWAVVVLYFVVVFGVAFGALVDSLVKDVLLQIIAGIFNITGDGRHDLQELIKFLALGQVAAG